jgi:hypothetical protein
MMAKIKWTAVSVYTSDGDRVTDADNHATLMREYRDTGTISQHYLTDSYDEDAWDQGLKTSEIDFTGLD